LATATEAARKFADRQGHWAKWYDDHKNKDGVLDVDAEGVKTFREGQDELKTLREERDELMTLEGDSKAMSDYAADLKRASKPVVGGQDRAIGGDHMEMGLPVAGKSLGERFVESEEFKNIPAKAPGHAMELNLDAIYGKGLGFKTLLDTAASWSIQNIRLPQVITPGAQVPTVASLMPEGRTSGSAIAYMEETTTTNSAAETAESGVKPESAMAFTEKTSVVRKIATSLPVTDEALEDIPFIESYIDTRLRFFVQLREDSELLVGSGTAPNLRGFLNVSGINTQARGTDASQDAIFKGAIAAQVASYFPSDAVVLHPNNWQTIRLMTTADGIYLFGPPSQAGASTLWGLNTVVTTAMTANTALVGAFRAGAEVFRRSEMSLQVGWINAQFTANQRTILVEERLALVVFRPSAFTKAVGVYQGHRSQLRASGRRKPHG